MGIWHINTGMPRFSLLKSHTKPVHSIAWSPDNMLLASGSADKTIILWNANHGTQESVLKGHSLGLTSVAFSPNGYSLVSSSYDKSIRIWSLKTGSQMYIIQQGHSDFVYSVAYSADGHQIVSASNDNTIRVWNAENGTECLKHFKSHCGAVTSAVFTPDRNYVISGSSDQFIYVWNAHQNDQIPRVLQRQNASITSVSVTSDSTHVLSASGSSVTIWDLETGKSDVTLLGHSQEILSVAVSPDRNYIASSAKDTTIRIWSFLPHKYSPSVSESGFLQYYNPQPYISKDGWCTYRDFKDLFLWIPPALMASVYTWQTHCIIGTRKIQIDLKDYAHGKEWARCGSKL